jgi:two-component system LytT family response regulator
MRTEIPFLQKSKFQSQLHRDKSVSVKPNQNKSEEKMKALIVDDERLARTELKRLLTPFKDIQTVGEAVNAEDAIEKINELKPDLIFLDIQMPGKSGFEMLEELDAVPIVVFTTAYDEYALKAFEYNALDYLLKPIEPKRLEETINKLIEKGRSPYRK